MEIQALRLALTEQDLNELIRRYLPPDQPVEEVRVRLSPEGLHVTGIYPFFFPVKFETVWELGIVGGQVSARLANFRAMGVPGNIFKSAIMKLIEDAARKEPWVKIAGDQVLADLDLGCARYGLPARLNLRTLTLIPGQLLVEAGA
jgi:hypothetical protein